MKLIIIDFSNSHKSIIKQIIKVHFNFDKFQFKRFSNVRNFVKIKEKEMD